MNDEIEKADICIKNGLYEEAAELLQCVLEEEPDTTEALWRIGVAYTELNIPEKAVKALDYFFKFNADHPQALEAYGCAQFKLGNYGTAKKYLELALDENHESSTIQRNLGVVYNQLGEVEKSYQSLKRSHEINPTDFRTLYALAMAHLHFRRYYEASVLLENMLSLDIPEDFQSMARDALSAIKPKLKSRQD